MRERVYHQIKSYYAPNTTPYSEMLTYEPQNNSAVSKNMDKNKR
jgi:hypothetical protein